MATAAIPGSSLLTEVIDSHGRVGCLLVILIMITASGVTDTLRIIHIQSPASQIESMDSIIAQFAISPVPVPVPVIMHQIIFVRASWGWALPQIIIQMRRGRDILTRSNRTPGIVIPTSSKGCFPNDSGMKPGDGLPYGRPGASLVAHLNHALVLSGRLNHPQTFLRVVASWFLDVDMLPGRTGKNGGRSMPMIAGCDHHRIQLLVVQHATEIRDTPGFGWLVLGRCDCLFSPLLIHVADVS